MKLLIVIVNYKTPALCVDALASIVEQARRVEGGARISVIDGDSRDDSASVIAHAIEAHRWNDIVDFRPLNHNGGFAFGNNRGIEPYLASAPSYVLLLNPDTVARDGAIDALLAHMDAHPTTGIAGSRLEDPDTTAQRSAFRFPSFASELEGSLRLGFVSKWLHKRVVAPPVREDTHATDWVAGASMIVRREVLERIGLLDEAYFMYFEEVDFCLRAARCGFGCDYVPASRVVHLVGQASGVTDKSRATRRRPGYWFDSRRRYFCKNHGRWYAIACDIIHVIGFATWRLRRAVQRKPDTDPQHFLRDLIRSSALFRGCP